MPNRLHQLLAEQAHPPPPPQHTHTETRVCVLKMAAIHSSKLCNLDLYDRARERERTQNFITHGLRF